MRAADIERLLAKVTGSPRSEIDQRCRWLRHFEAFPKGRGRHAPHLDPSEAAEMLLTLTSRRATDAKEVTTRVRCLEPVPRRGVPAVLVENVGGSPSPYHRMFLAFAVGIIISNPDNIALLNIHSIEVSESGAAAWIVFTTGKRFLYTDNKTVFRKLKKHPELYDRQFQATVERRLILGAEFLHQLAGGLGDDMPDISGWTGPVRQTAMIGEAE